MTNKAIDPTRQDARTKTQLAGFERTHDVGQRSFEEAIRDFARCETADVGPRTRNGPFPYDHAANSLQVEHVADVPVLRMLFVILAFTVLSRGH
jgi:hypothetical protein